jgi:tetratricopeptide (TPR) repeat protein
MHRIYQVSLIGLLALAAFLPRPARAQAPAQKELPYKRVLAGDDALRVAELKKRVGDLTAAGKFAEAQGPAEEVAAILERAQGRDHWATDAARLWAQTLKHMAALTAKEQAAYVAANKTISEAEQLEARGKYDEARPLYEKALAIRREVLGEDHPYTAAAYSDIANNLDYQGKYTEARPLLEKALAVWRKALGEGNPDTASGYHNLALNLNYQGKYTEARPLLEKALAIWRQALGEGSLTATGYNSLGLNLGDQGKLAEAQPLLEKALAIRRQVLGEGHFYTGNGYNNLAVNLARQGKYAEARPLFEKALAIWRQAQGEGHPDTAFGYLNLGRYLDVQEKHAEAQPLLEKALAIRRKALGENHPDTALYYHNLADNLRAQGKYAEAQSPYEKALAIWSRALGEDHPMTAHGYDGLAYNLFDQGRYAEAQPLFEKALAMRRKVLGVDHWDTASGCKDLARDLMDQGRYPEAEARAAEAARGFEAARLSVNFAGLDRAAFARGNSPLPLLAVLLARRGKPVEAWRRLEEGLARGLLDDLAARQGRPLSDGDHRREEELLGRLQLLDRQLTALLAGKDRPEARQAQADRLRDERAEAQRRLDELEAELARMHGPTAGQVYGLARVQAQLPKNAALIAWVDLEDDPHPADPRGKHWACLLRQRGAPAWVRLEGSGPGGAWTEDDTRLTAQVRDAVANRPSDVTAGWQGPAGRLYRQRLAPLAERLAAGNGLPAVRELVVLPSSGMAGVPVEALLAARPAEAPALTVSYAPSATLLAWLRERHRDAIAAAGGPGRLLALGDPAFAAPARPLDLPPPPDHGVLLTGVVPAGNAARVGLQAGDVLLDYAGKKLTALDDLATALHNSATPAPGKGIPVTAWRGGRTLELHVAPGPLGVMVSNQPAAETIRSAREANAVLARARGENFVPLPGSRREVEAIARLSPQADTLLGPDASEQRLDRLAGEGRLRQYRFLHFATHGVIDPGQPMRSFLALSQDSLPDPVEQVLHGRPAYSGRLTAADILHRWKLDADLVTLSACKSGRGKYEAGEGFVGFAQGLLLAGAHSLVLSEWSVDDDATSLLMIRFYQNLLGKRPGLDKAMPKAEALREAKEWLRNLDAAEAGDRLAALPRGTVEAKRPAPSGPRPYAHPYYWAAFILVGDPD